MIVLDNVTKTFPDGTVAVKGLSLSAPNGKITVLVGPSGCGKTTSLRMINRMIDPSSGTITIDGDNVMSADPSELRRRIGYVIQHAGLFPHRKIADNIATVPRLLGWSKTKARQRSMELMELVGLDSSLAGKYPNQLSGGQQQRVGVARALAADPPVMLMDEPFSAVDPIVREQLQDEFQRLQADLGKTIVFVTHDIDEAIKIGDQVAVLRVGGTLAQMNSPEELLADPHDDFVADFIGKDRGYRVLGFEPFPNVAITQEVTVRIGTAPSDLPRKASGRWVLVVDEHNRPQGWIDTETLRHPVSIEDLHRGGTTVRRSGSLRAAVDAVLSSPAGRGVVTDDDGVLVGTVAPDDVLLAARQRTSSVISEHESPSMNGQ